MMLAVISTAINTCI